jgi:hypothetical protein
MCAQVLKFRQAKERAPAPATGTILQSTADSNGRGDQADTATLQFWIGASGKRYIHTVHSLIDCPEVPHVNYLLVRKEDCGFQTVLAAGHTTNRATSLNLAEIRRLGATLGANEVHVHMLAGDDKQAKVIEHDLRASQLQSSIPTSSPSQH